LYKKRSEAANIPEMQSNNLWPSKPTIFILNNLLKKVLLLEVGGGEKGEGHVEGVLGRAMKFLNFNQPRQTMLLKWQTN
tara:strand:+ start:3005 stop:3241 length:237 start_codon:yes stop_codon:yes gene_type:complete